MFNNQLTNFILIIIQLDLQRVDEEANLMTSQYQDMVNKLNSLTEGLKPIKADLKKLEEFHKAASADLQKLQPGLEDAIMKKQTLESDKSKGEKMKVELEAKLEGIRKEVDVKKQALEQDIADLAEKNMDRIHVDKTTKMIDAELTKLEEFIKKQTKAIGDREVIEADYRTRVDAFKKAKAGFDATRDYLLVRRVLCCFPFRSSVF